MQELHLLVVTEKKKETQERERETHHCAVGNENFDHISIAVVGAKMQRRTTVPVFKVDLSLHYVPFHSAGQVIDEQCTHFGVT